MRVTRHSFMAAVAALITTLATTLLTTVSVASAQDVTAAAGDDYRVATPSGIVQIPKSEWKAVPNADKMGEAFEQRKIEIRHRFPRRVTVFKIHMTEDTRVGTPISPTEYLQMWVEQWGTLTIQIRADKGRYWVMSRETVLAPTSPSFDTSAAKDLSDIEIATARELFEAEIDQTRFLLESAF